MEAGTADRACNEHPFVWSKDNLSTGWPRTNQIFPLKNVKWDAAAAVQSCLTFVTPGTIALQAPLSMGFPRQEYWSELPFPSPGDLPDSGIEPTSPALAGGFCATEPLSPCQDWHFGKVFCFCHIPQLAGS